MPRSAVSIRSLLLDPPLLNGSGAVDVVSIDPAWNVPDATAAKLGAFVTKTVTAAPRAGHPAPWAEVLGEGTLLNSVGLANPGIEAALDQWSSLPARLGIPIVVSIGDPDPAQLAELVAAVTAAGWAEGIELNLSCPNVEGGVAAGERGSTQAAVRAARAATSLPLFAKLSPACGDVRAVARAAVEAGADALTCGNSMPAWASGDDGAPLLGAGFRGGLSGRGLHNVALRLVADASAAVDVPIVGLGGIDGAAAARRMLAAGASIIGVGTAAVLDPGVVEELRKVAP